MLGLDLPLRDRPADRLHFPDVFDGIHLLSVGGIDTVQPERIEPLPRKFRVVTRVSEELRHVRDALADNVADFAIERIAGEAVAENAAEEILLVECGGHERSGNRFRIVEEIHLFRTEVGVGIGTGPGAYRDQQHFVLAGGPAKPVGLGRRHQEKLECGIVIHGHVAIDKDELVWIDRDDLRRKVGRCRGARTDQLPERQVGVAARGAGQVELRLWVVRKRPGRVGRRVAQHDHQKRLELVGAKGRVLADDFPQHGREPIVAEFRFEALPKACLLEHLRAALEVEVADLIHALAKRHQGGNDGAGAGAGDVVEIV